MSMQTQGKGWACGFVIGKGVCGKNGSFAVLVKYAFHWIVDCMCSSQHSKGVVYLCLHSLWSKQLAILYSGSTQHCRKNPRRTRTARWVSWITSSRLTGQWFLANHGWGRVQWSMPISPNEPFFWLDELVIMSFKNLNCTWCMRRIASVGIVC